MPASCPQPQLIATARFSCPSPTHVPASEKKMIQITNICRRQQRCNCFPTSSNKTHHETFSTYIILATNFLPSLIAKKCTLFLLYPARKELPTSTAACFSCRRRISWHQSSPSPPHAMPSQSHSDMLFGNITISGLVYRPATPTSCDQRNGVTHGWSINWAAIHTLRPHSARTPRVHHLLP